MSPLINGVHPSIPDLQTLQEIYEPVVYKTKQGRYVLFLFLFPVRLENI